MQRIGLVKSSSIKPRRLEFLWPGRIPFRAVYMLDGDGGVSKSTLTCMMAAHISKGLDWPDGQPCPQGRTILCNTEDLPEEIIIPRLIAAGADRDKVDILLPGEGGETFSIPENVGALEECISQDDQLRLIVFDPMLDYLSTKTSNISEQQVRRALSYLTSLAQRRNISIILIRHLNKNAGQASKYRGSGSMAFYNLSRAGIQVTKHPSNKEHCLMVPNKANWTRESKSIEYHVESYDMGDGIETSHVVWDGMSEATADDLQAVDLDGTSNSELSDATNFLQKILSRQPLPSEVVFSQANSQGYSKGAVYRAARLMKVEKVFDPATNKWIWMLKD